MKKKTTDLKFIYITKQNSDKLQYFLDKTTSNRYKKIAKTYRETYFGLGYYCSILVASGHDSFNC